MHMGLGQPSLAIRRLNITFSGTNQMLAASLLFLASPQIPAVDAFVQAEMERTRAPGMTVLVIQGGETIHRAAYGKASLELDADVTPETKFESGSIGKSFTATAVMLLVEKGDVSLDDPVEDHVDGYPELWKGVTVENLITHTSGIPEYAVVEGLYLMDSPTREEWFERMSESPLEFEPGSRFSYSNSNYLLLGEVIRKATGKSPSEFIPEAILEPADMTETLWASHRQIIPNRAQGYYIYGPDLINAFEMGTPEMQGDGGWITTIDDLAKFDQALRDGKIVKPETLEKMRSHFILNNGRRAGYGYGWFIRTINGNRAISHGGNSTGYASSITHFPDRNLTVAIMCNIYQVSGDSVAQRIAAIVDPELKPRVFEEQPDPNPELTKTLFEGLALLAKGEIDPEYLDENLAGYLVTGRGQMQMSGYAPYESFDEIAFLIAEPNEPDTTRRYRAKKGDISFAVTFVVTSSNKIFSVGVSREN